MSLPVRRTRPPIACPRCFSFYDLAYALNAAVFPDVDVLWAVVGVVVLLSIVIHGITATPAVRWLERRAA